MVNSHLDQYHVLNELVIKLEHHAPWKCGGICLANIKWFSSQNNFSVCWYIYLIAWTSRVIPVACQEEVCLSGEQGQGVLSLCVHTDQLMGFDCVCA